MKRRDPRDWVERFVEDSCRVSEETGDPVLVNPFLILAFFGLAMIAMIIDFAAIAWEN